jgi:hypothetical protein
LPCSVVVHRYPIGDPASLASFRLDGHPYAPWAAAVEEVVLGALVESADLVCGGDHGRQGTSRASPASPPGDAGVTRTVMPGTVSTHHPPAPPTEPRQQQGVVGSDDGSPRPLAGPSVASPCAAARELADGLYRGLGSELRALTGPVRRRELAIAAQLVAVGATAAEAEAYARDMAALPGRLAPVDLRGFERERPSWLARRRGGTAARRYVDRTGQGIGDPSPDAPPAPGWAVAAWAGHPPAGRAPAPRGAPEARAGSPPDEEQLPEAVAPEKAWVRAVHVRLEGTDDVG